MELTVARHDSPLGRWEMASRDAHPGLRSYVGDYTGYVEATPGPLRRREVPGPEITLIVSFGPTIAVDGERYGSFVAGLSGAPVITEHAGFQHGVEVRLTPLGARRMLGVPMDTLADRVVALEDLLGRSAALLAERMYEAPGWAERFDLLDAAIARRLTSAPPADPAVAWAWRRLRETHGALPIGALSADLGWSRRHLAVRFRDQIGLPPKLAARILRFDHVVAVLRNERPERWAEVAYAGGYYDQAHFNRDFREFAGSTPSAFLASRLPDGGGFAG